MYSSTERTAYLERKKVHVLSGIFLVAEYDERGIWFNLFTEQGINFH